MSQAQALIKKREQLAKEIQSQMDGLAKTRDQLAEINIQLYKALEHPDCLFNDSPISNMRMTSAIRKYLAKIGWKWAIPLYNGTEEVKTFLQEVKDSSAWAQRFDTKEQTSIKSII